MKKDDDKTGDIFEAYARNTDPETSHAAAASMDPHLPDLEQLALNYLRVRGAYGATTYEMSIDPFFRGIDRCTITPRLRPLCRKGLVVESEMRRPGATGRKSVVWVAA